MNVFCFNSCSSSENALPSELHTALQISCPVTTTAPAWSFTKKKNCSRRGKDEGGTLSAYHTIYLYQVIILNKQMIEVLWNIGPPIQVYEQGKNKIAVSRKMDNSCDPNTWKIKYISTRFQKLWGQDLHNKLTLGQDPCCRSSGSCLASVYTEKQIRS